MKKYSISKDFVIRHYGNLIMGYFYSDPAMRYFTIEGATAQIIEELHKGTGKTEKKLINLLAAKGMEEQMVQSNLGKLVSLAILEVKLSD